MDYRRRLASASMFGDLLSSFIKRRLGLRTHSQAFGLDQVPESLLPLLLLQEHLGLSGGDIALVVTVFIALELLLSRLLFKLHIRDQPIEAQEQTSRCRVTSGGQLSRTSTMHEPAPTEV